ncbi:diguanylate cyclase (GGDEF)-like protein [Natronospira proteinivora]|uniref:diguanylate cyclase n=1 Tax=Natronospira proteinivora TaxID=1807133 RepID=A0ABT1G7D9_9GAMM|nr:GGDEF domain-containing protein [Natronospira proteinivora]MCP1727209.1 diguanylate cyclase (GGDEF)-like protein [Natronospira proteinivora]
MMLTAIIRRTIMALLLLGAPALVVFWVTPQLSNYLQEDYRLWQSLAGLLAVLGMVLAALFSQWRISSALALMITLYLLVFTNGSLPGAGWFPLQLLLLTAVLTVIAVLPEWGPVSPATILTGLCVLLAVLIGFYELPPVVPSVLEAHFHTLYGLDLGLPAIVAGLGMAIVLAVQLWRPEPTRGAVLIGLVCIFPVTLTTPSLANWVVHFATAVLALWGGLLAHAWALAFIDELTGLPNRRALDYRLRRRQLAIAMVDVDHFKKFNDTWGHDAGDEVLRWVAHTLSRRSQGAKAYRYGGEEFAIVFRTAHPAKAGKHLEALRRNLYENHFKLRGPRRNRKYRGKGGGKPVRITASFGLAMARSGEAPAETMRRADAALYRAKRNGRNRVVVSE